MTTRFIKKPIKRKPMRESYEDFVIENGVLVEYRGNDTDIVVPDEVREIGKGAFKDCDSLTSVSLPQVQKIGEDAFLGCYSLTSVSMPKVQEIGKWAFYGCTSLTSVTLPNVKTIGKEAFGDCDSLTDIDISPSAEIGMWAFASTPIEQDVKEQFGLTERMSRKHRKPMREGIEGDFQVEGNYLVKYLGNEADVVIPDEIEIVGSGAFEHRKDIVSVKGKNVKSIYTYAFTECYNLKSVDFPNVEDIEFSAFYDTGITAVDFPNATTIGRCAFQGCERLKVVNLPKVKEIGLLTFNEAGRYAGGIKINMPNLKVIGDYAFERAYLADPTDFPSVVTIREGAFNLAKMRTLNIPNVRKIGRNAFTDCMFNEINANPTVEVAKSAFGKRLSMVSVKGEPYVLANDNGTYRAGLKSNSAEYGEKYSKSRRPFRKAKGIKEADGDMKTYEIIYTVDGTLSKQKVRAASQTEAESLIKERNKGNVVIQTAKEIRGITEDVDKDVRLSPESGAATGIASMLIDAINDEWETINRYNSMVATIRGMLEDIDNIEGVTAGDLQDTVEIIENINNEENNHVGMLQSALALYSENVETIKDGEKEADGIMTDVADGEIIKDEFADDEYVGKLVKNVRGVVVDA